MIKSVKISDENDVLFIPFINAQEEPYLVTNIDGVGPLNATVNISENSFVDGGEHTSSHIGARPINIHILYNDNVDETVEELRNRIVRLASVKKEIRLDIETATRNYFIYGIVEKNEQVIFSSACGVVISMICPYPFFRSQENATATSSMETGVTFPITNNAIVFENKIIDVYYINNDSTQECYPTVKIKFISTGTDMSNHGVRKLVINYFYNDNLHHNMTLNFGHFVGSSFSQYDWATGIQKNDEIVIETEPGKKSVKLYKNNGTVINILYCLEDLKTWLRILPNNGNSSISFSFYDQNGAVSNSIMCLYSISWFERYESI